MTPITRAFNGFFIVLFATLYCTACQQHTGLDEEFKSAIYSDFLHGEYALVRGVLDSLELDDKLSQSELEWIEILRAKMHRIGLDFTKNENQILDQLKHVYPAIMVSDLKEWEKTGALEMKVLNGEKKYFKYAVNNLFRIDSTAKKQRENILGKRPDGLMDFRVKHISDLLTTGLNRSSHPGISWKASYTLTVDANAVPAGEIIRCWLPYPREHQRQKHIELISTSEDHYHLASTDQAHQSIYMEKTAQQGEETVFNCEFRFTTFPEWHHFEIPSQLKAKEQPTPGEYLAEQLPHIVFSETVRHFADSLTNGITNPIQQARTIFKWISTEIPWASDLRMHT